MAKSDDSKKRDAILKRMLETPPKPHKPKADKPPPKKKKAAKRKAEGKEPS